MISIFKCIQCHVTFNTYNSNENQYVESCKHKQSQVLFSATQPITFGDVMPHPSIHHRVYDALPTTFTPFINLNTFVISTAGASI